MIGFIKTEQNAEKLPWFPGVSFRNLEHIEDSNLRIPNRLVPFMLYFMKQMKGPFLVIFSFFTVSSVLLGLQPYFIKVLVEAIESLDGIHNAWHVVGLPFALYFIFVLIVQPIAAQLGNYYQAYTLPHFTGMVRRQLSLYMHRHSYRYYQDDFAGRLAGKIVETPSSMSELVYLLLGAISYAFIMLIVSVILFASVSLAFGILSGMWLLLYGIFLWIYVPQIQKLSKKASDERSHTRGRYVDILTNILTVKLFARTQHEDSYFRDSLWKTANGFIRTDLKLWEYKVFLEIITTIAIAGSFGLALWGYLNKSVSLSEFVMIIPLTLQVGQTTWWVSDIFTNLFQRVGEIQEGMDSVIKKQYVQDKETATEILVKDGTIDFNHVRFQYKNLPVFGDLDLHIQAGQKVGILGPSGAGKSTLQQILLRLYDIDDGSICIDGKNIADVTQESLRSQISVIPQSSDLLHRSLADNIRYGRLDASNEDIIYAAKKAHAHEFILQMQDQHGNEAYEAQVGERGVKLSGGQRQRIAIARAILKDSPILILDEATSALDSESEKLIQESLHDLMIGKTVIAIAHRLSTIAHLDRLIVLHEGKIIEDGSHTDLMTQDGLYAKLWGMQSGGFLGDQQES